MITQRALAVSVCGLLLVAACGDDGGFTGAPCEDDTNCNLSGGGKCVLASTGNKWCAYPDPDCSGGLRFSDHIGDELSNVCIEAQKVRLAITVDGPGTVAAVPSGITCTGTQCAGDFIVGTEIKLVATATSMAFLGWTGACKGTSDCTLTLVADTTVGAFFGAPGTALWAKQFGGIDFDEAKGVARDSQDNLVVVGRFNGTANFGGTMLTSAGGGDVFVAKLKSSDGSVIWVKKFGATGQDIANKVAIDAGDAIYVAGSYKGQPDFGGGALPDAAGNSGAFVLKLDAAGAFVWAKGFGAANSSSGVSDLALRAGKLVTVGGFSGTMIVGGSTLTGVGGRGYAFQLSASGTADWAAAIGNAQVAVNAVSIDSAGAAIVTGTFTGGTTIGTQALNSAGAKDIFLTKLNGTAGTFLFATRYGGIGVEEAEAVTVDTGDGIYLAGSFTSTVDFGVGPMTAMGTAAYLAKFTIAGACTWSKQFGGDNGAAYALATGLSANASGDVVVVGAFTGTISLGGSPLNAVPSSSFGRDVFAGRLKGQDGSHVSSMRTGGQGDELTNSVVQTSDGKYFVVGGFDGLADFGGQSLTSAGLKDGFVFAMAPL